MDQSNVRNSVGSLRKRVIFLALVLALVGASVASPAVGSEQQGTGEQQEDALPQEGNGDVFTNVDEAARQSSNPLGGDFMVLLNQWYFDFQQGDSTDSTRNSITHVVQPVIPIRLGGDWIWVTRPTLPIVYNAEIPNSQPSSSNRWKHKSGIGDFVLLSMAGLSKPTETWGGGDIVLAAGVTSMFPTGNKEFSKNKFSIGPALVSSFIGREFIVGALFQQWNSFADGTGSNPAPGVNLTNVQYFYWKNFPGGWQVGGSPIIEVDWGQGSGDRWSVPIGLGVQKTHFFDGVPIPIRVGVEAQWYPVLPDTLGREWRIQLTLAPIIPNFIGQLLR